MGYYKQLLENWQNILDAMAKIDKDNQSRYFSDFKNEVKNRIDEYKFLSEKEKTTVIGGFFLVSKDKEFKFKNLCPYCKGDLTYRCNGWEQDDNSLWMADSFDVECSTEPDINSEEWEDWLQQHSEMPYVYQLPVDEKVKDFINQKYRFDVR